MLLKLGSFAKAIMSTQGICEKFRLVVACALFLNPWATGQQPLPIGGPDETVKEFLQKNLNDGRVGADKTTRFSSGVVKRKDGTIEEVIVYLSGQSWCGSGGCTLLILEPSDSSYNIIGRTSIVRLPIRILDSVTKGHRDIAVRVKGGGITSGYEALLQFNGKTYPNNPSVPPARRLTRKTRSEVLIPIQENSQSLFK